MSLRRLKVFPTLLDEVTVSRLVLPENALNGGLPEPPASEAVRVIDAHHDACGAATRVRLPGTLSPRAVRRFHCAGCAAAFVAQHIEEVELRMADGMAAGEVTVTTPEVVNVEAQPEAMEDKAVQALTRPPKPKGPSFLLRAAAKPKAAKPKLALPSLSLPKVSLPKVKLPKIDPDSRSWKLASLGIAALLVVVVL